MINDDSLRAVADAQWTPRFIKPLYESYCFAQLPGLVRALLTGGSDTDLPARLLGPLAGDYERVVLFFIDAFGWRFVERYCEEYPFLRRIARDGVVTKLTSQFPSTTAAHVTAIHTGLPVGLSGVYEWFYYEPLVDAVIAPLLFSYAGDQGRNTLQQTGIAPEAFYPRPTLYHELQTLGVQSFIFQHRDYTPSPYSDVVFRGAYVVPYTTLPEALATFGGMLSEHREKSYYILYFDKIDSVGHHYGPASPQVAAEIDAFLSLLERALQPALAGAEGRTLFLMTADHGQVEIDPATTVYLNVALPEIVPCVKTGKEGRLLAPAGSPRDMFLHIKSEHLDDVQARMGEHLRGKAEVYRVADLIDQGFFCAGELSPTFLHRVGDLVVLPYEHESVWWYERDRFEQHYYGHHGGLARPEMETVLLAHPYP